MFFQEDKKTGVFLLFLFLEDGINEIFALVVEVPDGGQAGSTSEFVNVVDTVFLRKLHIDGFPGGEMDAPF
jgi:hypothetical protein